MTTQLPRPIEPGEIRVGDRVRLGHAFASGDTYTYEFAVTKVGRDYISDQQNTFSLSSYYTWTLLARPTPAPKSWRQELADEIRKFADGYADVPGYWHGHIAGVREAADLIENREFGKSIPDIPDHGDGCSPWLWDEETGTAWVEYSNEHTAITHSQVSGPMVTDGFMTAQNATDRARAARLVPWSARGQANG